MQNDNLTTLERIAIIEKELSILKEKAKQEAEISEYEELKSLEQYFIYTPFQYSRFRNSSSSKNQKTIKLEIFSKPLGQDTPESGIYSHGGSFRMIVALLKRIRELERIGR